MDDTHIWNIIKDHFDKKGSSYIQIESYNDFITRGIQEIIDKEPFFEIPQKGRNYKIEFSDPYFSKPSIIEEDRKLREIFPNEARNRDLSYDSALHIDITETIEEEGCEPEVNIYHRVNIARIPVMLQSSLCNLSNKTPQERIDAGECENDPGGYFVIRGKERAIVAQQRGNYNQVYVYLQKISAGKAAIKTKYKYIAEIRSMSEETGHSVLVQTKIGIDEKTIVFSLPYITQSIPVGILFKSLGFTTKDEFQNLIGLYGKEADKYMNYIDRDSFGISCQDEALEYIGKFAMHIIPKDKRKSYAWQVVETELFPHLGITASIKEKAVYCGHMINKLLSTQIGLRKDDDRDNVSNKRVEMVGTLMNELFKMLFKRFLKTAQVQLEKSVDLLLTFSRINIITAGFKHVFATGNWGIQKNTYVRTGVSQVLSRMTWGATISHLRRIVIPIGKEGKNAKIRQIHPSQYGFQCPTECFDPNTPILLWNGSIKLAKDIIVGDKLIEDNGNSTEVRTICSGHTLMYEIQQLSENCVNYTVTSNHILTLKIKKHKKIRTHRGKYELMWFDKINFCYRYKDFDTIEEAQEFKNNIDDDILDITIENYLKLSDNVKKNLYGFKCDRINWPKKDVKLDPYILGMWLGDGMKTGKAFACADKELIDYWIKWGENNDATIKHGVRYSYGISSTINNKSGKRTEKAPLKKLLEEYNLIHNKHIPIDYIVNDRDTRLKLLAGLVDTDGSVRDNGHEIRISQGPRNFRIIEDTLKLARSLGFSCHVNDGNSSWTHNGEKKYGKYKELRITGEFLYEIPTRLHRKKLNMFDLEKSRSRCSVFLQTPIKVVEKDIGPFVGWQLYGNGRFLLDDFTVVHNTPEGQSSGIVTNFANLATVSKRVSTIRVRNILNKNKNIIHIKDFDLEKRKSGGYIKVFLNGIILGFVEDSENLLNDIKKYKINKLLDNSISASYDSIDEEIRIYADEGRLMRPLFNVDKIKSKLLLKKTDEADWDALVNKDVITYIDSNESENSVIAMFPSDLEKEHKYDYCEIHPSMMIGVMASIIPFPEHSPAPRNCFQCLDPEELVVMGDGSKKKIGDIKVGDNVISIDPKTCLQSITKVINQYIKSTDKNIITVTTVSGRKIKCTDDHLFLTSDGWIMSKDAKNVCIIPQYDDGENDINKLLKAEYNRTCNHLSISISYEEWLKNITIKEDAIFVNIESRILQPNILICDITTESDNHSFIAGDSFCVHNSSMGKQALGMFALNHQIRTDTVVHVLEYSQKPIVSTKPAEYLKFSDMPSGVNCIVAIMCLSGFNY